ncbi:MAG: helix-turn-helix domain-containing protein [Candidatus Lokiarchaeota archaeon]
MLKKYHSYLRDIGLSEVQIQLYDYILESKSGTINQIKEDMGYSYAQINYNMSVLEDIGLVFSSKSNSNKKFYRIDPQIALTKVLDEKIKDFKEQIEKIDEKVKAEDSSKGKCIANINFYHYSDVNLAIQYYYKLIEDSKEEIYMTSLPASVLKKLEPVLYNAFLRGIRLVLFFSRRDFESFENYFDVITDIFNRIRIEIIEIKERTCQYVRYNDIIVNNGLILIDGKYLNTILFIDDDIFHFDGFFGPNFVQEAKRFLEIKTVKKRIQIDYPDSIQSVLNVIKKAGPISTSELSKEAKIGGTKLREALDFLKKEGMINEVKIQINKPGKPRLEYSINHKISNE